MGRSREEQRAEVLAWRGSGKSMATFAASRGYSRSSLEKWTRAVRDEAMSIDPGFVRLAVARNDSEIVVDVGVARIRVRRGFDATLLRDVVVALGEKGA